MELLLFHLLLNACLSRALVWRDVDRCRIGHRKRMVEWLRDSVEGKTCYLINSRAASRPLSRLAWREAEDSAAEAIVLLFAWRQGRLSPTTKST